MDAIGITFHCFEKSKKSYEWLKIYLFYLDLSTPAITPAPTLIYLMPGLNKR